MRLPRWQSYPLDKGLLDGLKNLKSIVQSKGMDKRDPWKDLVNRDELCAPAFTHLSQVRAFGAGPGQ